MSYGRAFVLTLLTDDPGLAARASLAGIDRVGPDLEIYGKEARQGGMGTRISAHDIARVPALRTAVPAGRLFARTNPINPGIEAEIAQLVNGGVDVLMLPFFETCEEVERFVSLVGGRARTVALIETAAAAARVREIVAVQGLDEVHFGLNDLRLSWGLDSVFEAWLSPAFEGITRAVRASGKPMGIAGIARDTGRTLPVPATLVYPLLPLHGATGSLVSRSFGAEAMDEAALIEAVTRFRADLDRLAEMPIEALHRAVDPLRRHLRPG